MKTPGWTMNQTASPRRRGIPWRRWNNALHRDVGYFCVALTLIYAVSGVAVNHVHHWNPNYSFERQREAFAPMEPGLGREQLVERLVAALDLPGPPPRSFRPSPEVIQLFYDGWNVEAHTVEGWALVERPRERPILRDANFLHLNHPKGLWTWFADIYAVLLGFLALSGIFVLRGRKGFAGRGKWFMLAGLALPLGFLLVLRYL